MVIFFNQWKKMDYNDFLSLSVHDYCIIILSTSGVIEADKVDIKLSA